MNLSREEKIRQLAHNRWEIRTEYNAWEGRNAEKNRDWEEGERIFTSDVSKVSH